MQLKAKSAWQISINQHGNHICRFIDTLTGRVIKRKTTKTLIFKTNNLIMTADLIK